MISTYKHYRGRPWFYRPLVVSVGLTWVAALLIVLPLMAQGAPTQDVVFLIDNSPSARTGEGAPDGLPTDPEGIRLRLPRFTVGALGLVTRTQNQRVGVVSFARKNNILVPLTPVQDWSKADFGHVVSENLGVGTDFAAALNVAWQMLSEDGNCAEASRQCDVIIFSDGVFDNPAADLRAVSNTLHSLEKQGVKVTLLTFIDTYATKSYSDSKQIWTNLKSIGLLEQYELNITPRFKEKPAEVYGLLFDVLQASELFHDFQYATFPTAITQEVPLFQRWVRWDIVADVPVEPVFRLGNQGLQPIRAGNTYLFADPPSGEWQIEFKGPAIGLVYFQQSSEAAPIKLNIRNLPETVTVGQDVPVVVNLTVGAGQSIMQTDLFTVTMEVTGPTSYAMLMNRESGQFVSYIPANSLMAGAYQVAVSAEFTDAATSNQIQSAQTNLRIVSSPVVKIERFPALVSPGGSVEVTVTIQNCLDSCVPGFITIAPSDTRQISLTQVAPQRFVTSLTLTETTTFVSWVSTANPSSLVTQVENSVITPIGPIDNHSEEWLWLVWVLTAIAALALLVLYVFLIVWRTAGSEEIRSKLPKTLKPVYAFITRLSGVENCRKASRDKGQEEGYRKGRDEANQQHLEGVRKATRLLLTIGEKYRNHEMNLLIEIEQWTTELVANQPGGYGQTSPIILAALSVLKAAILPRSQDHV